MAYLTPEEKSQIVRDLLKQYIVTSLKGAGEKIREDDIQCMSKPGFDECHIVLNAKNTEPEFDVNRDSISSGAEVPDFLNDFPVYMCWYSVNGKTYFRVWTYWGDVEFK